MFFLPIIVFKTYFLEAGLEMKKVLFLNALKDARKCFYHQEHVNLIQFKVRKKG